MCDLFSTKWCLCVFLDSSVCHERFKLIGWFPNAHYCVHGFCNNLSVSAQWLFLSFTAPLARWDWLPYSCALGRHCWLQPRPNLGPLTTAQKCCQLSYLTPCFCFSVPLSHGRCLLFFWRSQLKTSKTKTKPLWELGSERQVWSMWYSFVP